MSFRLSGWRSPARVRGTAAVLAAMVAGSGCGGDGGLDLPDCGVGNCESTTTGNNGVAGDAGATGTTGSTPGITGGTGTTGQSTGTSGTSGGTSSGTTGPAVDADTLPCDVKAIVDAKCGACHSDPPVGAYMPLVTKSDFHDPSTTDPSRPYYELAKERINSADSPMPPPPPQAEPLTDAELATLNSWLDSGAPAGTEACGGGNDGGTNTGGPPTKEIDTTGLECHQFLAHAPNDKSKKYPVGVAVDAYFDMVFDAPWDETVYGIVIKPITDNAQVLHHWILYREPGAGTDGEVRPGTGAHGGAEMIYGWAPGGIGMDFRTRGDVATELPPDQYLMEFHYNSNDASAMDASGVEVCFQREPPEHVAGLSWLGYDHGAEGYIAGAIFGSWASGTCLAPSDTWTGTCDPVSEEPIHLLYVTPHLHEAGMHVTSVINGTDGSERTLHDMPFSFDYQVGYEVDEVLMPGETITTTCYYTEPKCSGQATGAEMCYLYTYAYPKDALRDNMEWGKLAHGDNVCLGQ